MDTNHIKPSLKFIAIPILLFIMAIAVSITIVKDPIMSMINLETSNMGSEVRIDTSVDNEQYHVYLEIDYDQRVVDTTIESNRITVVLEDSNDVRENYTFEVERLGAVGTYYFEVFTPRANTTTTLNNLTYVFSIELETSGRYVLDSNGVNRDYTKFSANQLEVPKLIGSIFIGMGIGAVISIISLVIFINIFAKRSKSKKKMFLKPKARVEEPDNPFEY